MTQFSDQAFLVTGGTSGIGLATTRRLVERGARVLVTGTNEERLAAVREELPQVVALANDAGDPAAVGALAAAARESFGSLDGAFFNAGFGRFQPLADVTAEDFDAQYGVNVRGVLLQARAIEPLLRDGGSILFNTSVARVIGMPGGAIYASTKGAVRTLTRVLARELGERSIRVNAVSPGPIATDFFNRTGMPQEEVEETSEWILGNVPLGRFGEPAEVAAVATFLLSDDASFVTGSEYVVDGGLTET